jgi:citrate lyase subunit beta / citryl-CoA lyase
METITRASALRRSLLYVPGDREEMLSKAAQRGADVLVLNLEDAVAPARKEAARLNVVRSLSNSDFGGAEVVVRTNPPDTDEGYRDLLAIVPRQPAAILLPKVRAAEEVRFVAWMIERMEGLYAIPAGRIKLMCMIESAAGVLAAPGIAASHPRVSALIFGAADFAQDVGSTVTPDQRALLYATSHLILAARQAAIDAIDAPHMKLGDVVGLAQSANLAREAGFDGKSAIHPEQIPTINAAFSPSREQLAWARQVIAALDGAGGAVGAALLDGQLIEAPHLGRARKIIALAEATGRQAA